MIIEDCKGLIGSSITYRFTSLKKHDHELTSCGIEVYGTPMDNCEFENISPLGSVESTYSSEGEKNDINIPLTKTDNDGNCLNMATST